MLITRCLSPVDRGERPSDETCEVRACTRLLSDSYITSLSWLLLLSLESLPIPVVSLPWIILSDLIRWSRFAGLGAEGGSTVRFVHLLYLLHRNLALQLRYGVEGTLQLLLDIIVLGFCLLLYHYEGPDLLVEIINVLARVIQEHQLWMQLLLVNFLFLLPACQLVLQVYWFHIDIILKPASLSLYLAHLWI